VDGTIGVSNVVARIAGIFEEVEAATEESSE
jgi:hypothetical protein